jgi:CheY-like chemotaxis protein
MPGRGCPEAIDVWKKRGVVELMNTGRSILIVEDTPDDVVLLKAAIRRAKLTNPIQVVTDGEAAVQYLCGKGCFADRAAYPVPGAILLDLKLPKLNGFDVLQWLKEHEEYRVIPVMVLSASEIERDVARAYQLGANCYLVKPGTLTELVELMELAFRFWTRCAVPPVPEPCEAGVS